MTAALRYEWMRIRTIRSTWWVSGTALVTGVALSFLIAWGVSESFGGAGAPPVSDIPYVGSAVVTQFATFAAPYFVAFLLAMVGVFAWGHEYRHGMSRTTLVALSSRRAVWVAKYLVAGLWVLVVAALTLLLSAVVGWAWLRDNGIGFGVGDIGGTVLRTLGYTLLFTWLAATFTLLTRNQAAALVLMFLWPLAVENVIALVFTLVPALRDNDGIIRLLPFRAGSRIITEVPVADAAFGEPMAALGGFVVFGVLTLVTMAIGLAVFVKRDA